MPRLYEVVCLALLPPAVLAGLTASRSAVGVDLSAIKAAGAVQQDPSRRLELCRLRHERGRGRDKRTVAVSYENGRLFLADKTSLTLSRVACVAQVATQEYAVATYGGMIMFAGGRGGRSDRSGIGVKR